MQAHFARSISGSGNPREATVGVSSRANAAFWGAKGRAGWYAAEKYAASGTPQFPPWVGNNWDVGVPGQGPYALNPAVFHELRWIEERYLKVVDAAAKQAFPEGV